MEEFTVQDEINIPVDQQEETASGEFMADESSENTGESSSSEVTPKAQESYQAKNFRALREKTAQLERERDEALKRLEELRENASEDDFSFNPDDLMEGKHLEKVVKRIKHLEGKIKNYESSSQTLSAETRLRTKYPDFDKVVNEDTIAILRERDPELAITLNANPDLFSKASSVYKVIKQFGIYTEDAYADDRHKVQKNASKPRPLASMAPQQSDSPLSHANAFANGLTDELKAKLFKEMTESRRRN